MLERPREQALCLDAYWLALAVQARTATAWPDAARGGKAGHAQAAFLLELRSAARRRTSGLTQTRRLSPFGVRRDVDDEQAQRDAHLRRREPDARRRIHRRDHVVDELLNLRRELVRRVPLDDAGTRVAVLDDGPEHRGVASGSRGRRVRSLREPRTAPARQRRWPRRARVMSARLSPVNFSRNASATTRLTMASPTTAAAVTAQTSLRSMAAGDSAQRGQIDRPERLHQRGDWLHVTRDAKLLAVGDAAFEAAGVVRQPRDADGRMPGRRFAGRHDLVVDARAWKRRDVGPLADANRLDRVNRHDGLREPPVELSVPLDVAAEARPAGPSPRLRMRRRACRRRPWR